MTQNELVPQAELDLSVTWIQSITGVSGQSARPVPAVHFQLV